MTMRVLHADSGSEWRGGQRQLSLLSEGLRELGYEPLVVAPPMSPLAERLRERGLAVSTPPMRSALDLGSMRQIRRLVRIWRPDAVHVHDRRAHALVLAALEGDVATPLVVTRRTSALAPPLGLQLGHRVARFVALSRDARAALIADGVDPVLIDVVPPGVDPPHSFEQRDWRARFQWPAESVVCGIVGPMSTADGLEQLARITRRLPQDVRERTRLVLFGRPISPRRSGRVVSDSPRDVGGVEARSVDGSQDGPELLAGLDLLWHTGSTRGLGTLVLDSMALGVPPIAFATGAIGEMIEQDQCGIVVPEADEEGFAAAVAGLVRDERRRRILAANGPGQVSRFHPLQMIRAHDRVYRSLEAVDSSSGASGG